MKKKTFMKRILAFVLALAVALPSNFASLGVQAAGSWTASDPYVLEADVTSYTKEELYDLFSNQFGEATNGTMYKGFYYSTNDATVFGAEQIMDSSTGVANLETNTPYAIFKTPSKYGRPSVVGWFKVKAVSSTSINVKEEIEEIEYNFGLDTKTQAEALKEQIYNAVVAGSTPAGITKEASTIKFYVGESLLGYDITYEDILDGTYNRYFGDGGNESKESIIVVYDNAETDPIEITLKESRFAAPLANLTVPASYTEDYSDAVAAKIKEAIKAGLGAASSADSISVALKAGTFPAEGECADLTYTVSYKADQYFLAATTDVTVNVTNLTHPSTINLVSGEGFTVTSEDVTAGAENKSGDYTIVVTPDWANKYYVTGVKVTNNLDTTPVEYTNGTYSENGVYTVEVPITNAAAEDTTYEITATVEKRDFAPNENASVGYNFLAEEDYLTEGSDAKAAFDEAVIKAIMGQSANLADYEISYDEAAFEKDAASAFEITYKGVENQIPDVTKTVNVTVKHGKIDYEVIDNVADVTVSTKAEFEAIADTVKATIEKDNITGSDKRNVTVTLKDGAAPLQGSTSTVTYLVVIEENEWYTATTAEVDVEVTANILPALVKVAENASGTITVKNGSKSIKNGQTAEWFTEEATSVSVNVEAAANRYVLGAMVNGEAVGLSYDEYEKNGSFAIADGTGLELGAQNVYEVTATFGEKSLTGNASTVLDINPAKPVAEQKDALEAEILDEIVTGTTPEVETSTLEVYYLAADFLGKTWEELDHSPSLLESITQHKFASKESETIKIVYPAGTDADGNKHPEVSITATVTFNDNREAFVLEDKTFTYITEIVDKAEILELVKNDYLAGMTYPEGITADDLTIAIASAEQEFPSEIGETKEVTYTVSYAGNETYKPATAKAIAAVTKIEAACYVEVDAETVTENGTILVNNSEASNPVPVKDGSTVEVSVIPANGKAVESITVTSKAREAVETSAITYEDGKATVTFTANGSTAGIVTYTVAVEYSDSAFEFEETREVTLMQGEIPTDVELYDAVVATPEYKDGAEITVEYLARPAGEYTINIPKLEAYGIQLYEGGDYTFELNELWLKPGTEITEVDLYAEIEDLKAMIEGIDDWSEIGEAASYVTKFFSELPNKQIGAHTFAYYGDGSTEQIRVSYKDDKEVIAKTTTDVTIIDGRIKTEIAGADAEVVYGFTPEELYAALGIDVVADGVSTGRKATFVNRVDGFDATETPYEVTVEFAGDAEYQPSRRTFNVTVKKAPCEINFDSQVVTWGTGYTFELQKTPEDVETIDFMIGLDVEGLSEDNMVPAGYIQLKLPGLLGKFFQTETTVGEFLDTLSGLTNASDSILGSLGVNAETVEYITNALESVLGDLEAVKNTKIKFGDNFTPENIGIYLAGAVTADSNYETAFTVDYLVVVPNTTEADLEFRFHDENGIITKGVIEDGTYDFGVDAYVDGVLNEEATKVVDHLFLKADTEGNITLTKVEGNENLDPAILSQTGAYTQMSYILEWGNNLYYALPIVRAYAVVAENVDVNFVEYAPSYTYDGKAHPLTVTVNGEVVNPADDEALTVTYYGVMANGELYNSTEAPVHAGAYAVSAFYHAKDANDETSKVGMAFATMTIEKAEASITVNDAFKVWDGETFDVTSMIETTPGLDKVALITFNSYAVNDFTENGFDAIDNTVNVDFPAVFDETLKKFDVFAPAYADGIDAEYFISVIESYRAKLEEVGISSETINAIVGTIADIPGEIVLTFHEQADVNPSAVGATAVIGLVFDSDYKPVYDSGILLIAPGEEELDLKFTDDWNEDFGFTKDSLANVNFDVEAYSKDGVLNEVATSEVKSVFVGFDRDGNYVETTDASTLDFGVYTQYAYILAPGATTYYAVPVSRTFIVESNEVTIEFDQLATVYNGEEQSVVARVVDANGNVIEDAVVILKYSDVEDGKAPVNAGTYTVDAVYVGSREFKPAKGTAEFVINKKEVEGTLADATKVYADEDPEFTATFEEMADEEYTVEYNREKGENVGTYVVTAKAESQNYIGKAVGSLTITKRPLTVVVDNVTKAYGETDPEFTATVEELVYDMDEIKYVFAREEGEEAGEYTIKATIEHANYTGEGEGTLTIEKALIKEVGFEVAAPVANADVQTEVNVPEAAGYTAAITWSANGEEVADTTYGYDTAYTATVTLTPDSNHTFAEKLVAPEGWDAVYDKETGVYTLTKTFEATEKKLCTISVSSPLPAEVSKNEAYVGEEVTVTATTEDGYVWQGWYAGDKCVSTDMVYTFTVEDDTELVATYKYVGTKKLVVTGEKLTFSVDGVDQYLNNYVEYYNTYTEVTVAATDMEEEFLYWMNEQEKIMSTERVYTVTLGHNTYLTPVYKNDDGATKIAVVEFVSYYQQVMTAVTYSVNSTIEFPHAPVRGGHEFAGWDMTAEEIKEAIANGDTHIRVNPVYEKIGDKHVIEVVYGDGTTEIHDELENFSVLDVVAPAECDGKKFSHWAADVNGETVLSYCRSYEHKVTKSTSLYAIYVYSEDEIEEQPFIAITDIYTSSVEAKDYVNFVAVRSIPEKYTVKGHGVLRTTSADIANSDKFVLDSEGVTQKEDIDANNTNTGAFIYSLSVGDKKDLNIYVRGFIILSDEHGNESTVYGPIVCASYNEVNGR